jgi:hypothetical protein
MLRGAPFDDLRAYLDRWAKVRLSCEPADRRLAEEGIRNSYAAAGLAPPDRIVWCGGPMEIAKRLATASPDDPIGANVKPRSSTTCGTRSGRSLKSSGKR